MVHRMASHTSSFDVLRLQSPGVLPTISTLHPAGEAPGQEKHPAPQRWYSTADNDRMYRMTGR